MVGKMSWILTEFQECPESGHSERFCCAAQVIDIKGLSLTFQVLVATVTIR